MSLKFRGRAACPQGAETNVAIVESLLFPWSYLP